MNRKIAIIVLVIILSLSIMLISCSNEKKVLNVYNWGEYIDPEIVEMFEEETGIEVNYRDYPTNEELYIKLKSGSGDFDVIFPSDYMLEKMVAEDMIAKIDFENIPNYKYINDRFKGLDYDKNEEYSVPYFWGTLGILYNDDKVDEEVDSWDILWNEKYSKKILILDSQRDSIAMALKRLGYSLNTTNDSELEEAKQSLIEQKPLVLAYVVDEVKNMMIQGEADLALTWSGEAIAILDEMESAAYSVPKEGSNLWFDCIAITKESSNKKEAEMFINFLSRPDVALQNTEWVGYSTPNQAAYDMLDDEIKSQDSYYPSDEVLDNCEVFIDLGEYNNVYGDLWLDVKISN
jgi:spermidine/putrescine transport system substrate-binding protein